MKVMVIAYYDYNHLEITLVPSTFNQSTWSTLLVITSGVSQHSNQR